MRLVTYGAACSLDGFIAARDGGLDWLHFSRDVQEVMASQWEDVDTILMGRKTYEFAAASGPGGSMPGISSYIFSTTMTKAPEGAQLISEDAGGFVRALKAQPGKNILVMGGGDLGRSLFRAGVVDEVGLNIHPILLGAGVPLFHDAGRIALTLKDSRVLDGGCILATYRVASTAAG